MTACDEGFFVLFFYNEKEEIKIIQVILQKCNIYSQNKTGSPNAGLARHSYFCGCV